MGVYAVLRKTWSHSTVTTALSFPKVSAVLQVHMGISLSLLNGTEIWHGLGWGLGGLLPWLWCDSGATTATSSWAGTILFYRQKHLMSECVQCFDPQEMIPEYQQ